MEQQSKEKQEREELLDKIKKSIEKNNKEEKTSEPQLIKNDENKPEVLDREEVVEKSKDNIDFNKVKKSKSLHEVFEDEAVEVAKKRNRIRNTSRRRNVNLGNVYSNTHK